MSTTQTRVSRWESGDITLLNNELDEALAICGAQRTGQDTLSDLLSPLRGDDQLRWYGSQAPAERIRMTSLHCSAVGKPLAGVVWPALLGALQLISGTTGCAVGGAVARSLTSPDRSGDHDLPFLDLEALATSGAWGLPARLPLMQMRIAQIGEADLDAWAIVPRPRGWAHPLVLVSEVQAETQEGRTAP